MSVSDAQRRATMNYRKSKTKTLSITMFPNDADIIEHLDNLDEPKAAYIRRLIRDDMERRARSDENEA